jgi:hypothetical protein
MIVMREMQLGLAAEAWVEQASRRSAEYSHFPAGGTRFKEGSHL